MGKPKVPKLLLYTSPRCPQCTRAKAYLRRLGVSFIERDIARSNLAHTEFLRLHGRGTPLLQVAEQSLQGFQPRRLAEFLQRVGLLADP